MAELLILSRSRVHATDPERDEEQPRRGDVIAVRPDGWPWGGKERSLPQFRILALPGVAVTAVERWLEREQWTAEDLLLPENDRPRLGRRVRRLNLDAALLPAPIKAYLADDLRSQSIRTVAVGGVTLLNSIETAVTPLRDRLRARLLAR